MTLTSVNEYKGISKGAVYLQIVAPASGRYGMPKAREHSSSAVANSFGSFPLGSRAGLIQVC
jgi:hypothetical protein